MRTQVSVYEGLRLERMAQEEEEEESRKEERGIRKKGVLGLSESGILREHTPSFLREHTPSFLREHTPTFMLSKETAGTANGDDQLALEAGRATGATTTPTRLGRSTPGSPVEERLGTGLALERVLATAPGLEKPRARRPSRELLVAETWVSRELAARELAVGGVERTVPEPDGSFSSRERLHSSSSCGSSAVVETRERPQSGQMLGSRHLRRCIHVPCVMCCVPSHAHTRPHAHTSCRGATATDARMRMSTGVAEGAAGRRSATSFHWRSWPSTPTRWAAAWPSWGGSTAPRSETLMRVVVCPRQTRATRHAPHTGWTGGLRPLTPKRHSRSPGYWGAHAFTQARRGAAVYAAGAGLL